MHLRCTRRMLDFLKPHAVVEQTTTDFFSWHADFQIVARKKLFILMHDQSRFCVVLYGLQKKDFENALVFFRHAIYVTMRATGYRHDLAFRYTSALQNITYGPTHDRKLVAQLNRAVSDMWAYLDDHLVISQMLQPEVAERLNQSPVGTNHWKMVHFPYQKMFEYLEAWDVDSHVKEA